MNIVRFALLGLLVACWNKADQSASPTLDDIPSLTRLVMIIAPGIKVSELDSVRSRTPNLGELEYRLPLQGPLSTERLSRWQTLHTGFPASQHGVFDGLSRMANTYAFSPMIRIDPARAEGKHLRGPGFYAERIRSPFWDVLAASGVKSSVLFPPAVMPLSQGGARVVAGDLPAVHGRKGKAVLAVAAGDPLLLSPSTGLLELDEFEPHAWRGQLPLLEHNSDAQLPELYVPVVVRREGDDVLLRVDGGDFRLQAGERSSYFSLAFRAGALAILGSTRVHLLSSAPPRILIEAIGPDPQNPAFVASSPERLLRTVVGRAGLGPFTDSRIWSHEGGAAFVDDEFRYRHLREEMLWRSDVLIAELTSTESRVLVVHFDAFERAHLLGISPAGEVLGADLLVTLDKAIEKIGAHLQEGDTLVVVSPHAPVRAKRVVDLNAWLLRRRYLHAGADKKIVWPKTQAYAAGSGGIYLNIRGRDPDGYLPPFRAARLARKIARELSGLKDDRRRVVARVFLGDEIFAGSYRSSAPDLVVALTSGYAVFSRGHTREIGQDIVFDADIDAPSGPLAPRALTGSVLSTRPFAVERARFEDVAATALTFSGITRPDAPGRSWFAPPTFADSAKERP